MPTYFTSYNPRGLSLPRRNLPPPRSLFKSENIFNQFGTFFPSLKHGWGFTGPQNKRKMENKEKETSLKWFYERVLESFNYNTDEYYAILEAYNEAWEKYEEEGI